jgi:hypothetical protein
MSAIRSMIDEESWFCAFLQCCTERRPYSAIWSW